MSEHGGSYRSDTTASDENEEGERRNTDETDDDSEAETEDETGNETQNEERADRAHLGDVADGSGCTEIWEHLSEQRETAEDD